MFELFLLLVVPVFLILVFALPIAALRRSREAMDGVRSFSWRVARLREDLEEVKRTLAGLEAEPEPEPKTDISRFSAPAEAQADGHAASSEGLKPLPAFTPESQLAGKTAPEGRTEAPPSEPREAPPAPGASRSPRVPSGHTDSTPPRSHFAPSTVIDWEKFAGARLFAWIGGLALFLGISFLVKYSIEHGLISPAVRVLMGFLSGTGAIVGGLRLARQYPYTAHTLCASGPAILFVSIYAAYDFYQFIGAGIAFVLMVLVTAAMFLLAVRLNSRYVALLGLLGGFLTPVLVSTGEDNPFGLFGYLALLNLGLVLVAMRRRWPFLVALSAAGTILAEMAWMVHFFNISKAPTAITIFLFFAVFFTAVEILAHRSGRSDPLLQITAAAVPLLALLSLGFELLSFAEFASNPGVLFLFILVLNLLVFASNLLGQRLLATEIAAGALTFVWILVWSSKYVTTDNLPWALAGYLVFAVLYAAFPLAIQKRIPIPPESRYWGNLYPVLMLIPIVMLIGSQDTVSALVWPGLFLTVLVGLLAIFALGVFWVGFGVLALSLGAFSMAFRHLTGPGDLGGTLIPLALFTVGFLAASLLLERKHGKANTISPDSVWSATSVSELLRLPVMGVLMPFLLLLAAILQLQISNPAPIFGLALLLISLLLGLAYFLRIDTVTPTALGAVALLEVTWHTNRFDPEHPLLSLPWYLVFSAIFVLYPFLLRASMRDRLLPWIASALSGPLHFFLIHDVAVKTLGAAYIGLLPLLLALMFLPLLAWVNRILPPGLTTRNSGLALFGGVTLFFLTLVFPLQFDKEWLTLGWALEGLALIWLFYRVPHPGLKTWGCGLLLISFGRLALNPSVLSYHPVEQIPIFNWYLYTYGVVAVCLALGAFIWRPREERFLGWPVRPTLYSLTAILAFLLMNIEIADFYSTGQFLTFEFGASFAQDLTYSLAWATFGLALLVLGIRLGSPGPRLAGLILVALTTLKLFFYDLWSLGQLYRVASFVGLALVLILISTLYQRLVSSEKAVSGPEDFSREETNR